MEAAAAVVVGRVRLGIVMDSASSWRTGDVGGVESWRCEGCEVERVVGRLRGRMGRRLMRGRCRSTF